MKKYTVEVNDTDLAVAQWLKDNNINFVVNFDGSSKQGDWDRDDFTVKSGVHSFEFHTGIGNRIHLKQGDYNLTTSQLASIRKIGDLYGQNRIDVFNKLSNGQYVIKPTQASILYCLLADMDCGSLAFDEFCDEFGYNQDSFKDFDIYKACLETKNKMFKIFTSKQRVELAQLLEDY